MAIWWVCFAWRVFWIQKTQQSYHFNEKSMNKMKQNETEKQIQKDRKRLQRVYNTMCAVWYLFFVGCGSDGDSGGVGVFPASLLFCAVNLMAYILFLCVCVLYVCAFTSERVCGWLLLVYRSLLFISSLNSAKYLVFAVSMQSLILTPHSHTHPSQFAILNDIENVFKRICFWCGVRAWVYDDKTEPATPCK